MKGVAVPCGVQLSEYGVCGVAIYCDSAVIFRFSEVDTVGDVLDMIAALPENLSGNPKVLRGQTWLN